MSTHTHMHTSPLPHLPHTHINLSAYQSLAHQYSAKNQQTQSQSHRNNTNTHTHTHTHTYTYLDEATAGISLLGTFDVCRLEYGGGGGSVSLNPRLLFRSGEAGRPSGG